MAQFGGARFISRRGGFNRKSAAFADMVAGRMAMDIEVGIKTTAGTPVKHGQMKAAVRHYRVGAHKFRVVSPKEYSAVQELGRRRGARPFANYTTPGTSSGWFHRAVNAVVRNKDKYVAEAKGAIV